MTDLIDEDWKKELQCKIDTLEKLKDFLENQHCTPEEVLNEATLRWFRMFDSESDYSLPFSVNRYYLQTALRAGFEGRRAILRQIIPDDSEFNKLSCELDDPLGEEGHSPVPGLVHQYPGRVLILTTGECAVMCRHCFRRSFTRGAEGALGEAAFTRMLEYIKENPGIEEVLLSGGDPLLLSDRRIVEVLSRIKSIRPELIIRICSRVPVVLPSRLTEALSEMLSSFSGLWLVTHFNHPAEITPLAAEGIRRIIRAGVPVLNQAVLLRGVNDSVPVLAGLFTRLLTAGVKPYYLFQGDLAAGTAHLRVPLEKSLGLVDRLKEKVSGMAMPVFALDLPGGGGKLTLNPDSTRIKRAGDYYIFKGKDNEEYRYPAN